MPAPSQPGILFASSSSCLGIRPSQVAVCSCLVLSSLFSHPSSRHIIQDFLCGTSYSAIPGLLPSLHFPPPALQGSGCHSVFPVTTLLIPSLRCQPEPAVIYPSETRRQTQAGVCSAVVRLGLEPMALGQVGTDWVEMGDGERASSRNGSVRAVPSRIVAPWELEDG